MSYYKNGILQSVRDDSLRGQQVLTEVEKEFKDSVYSLFDVFKTLNLEYISEIQTSRSMRKLDDPYTDPVGKNKGPQLNTLNSTIDNIKADYVDNAPEVVLMPETVNGEETARSMTDVISWVLHHADFPMWYQEAMEDVLVTGTGIIQDMYDESMTVGGISGNIGLEAWPPESFLPDPAYDEPQNSRAIFKVCSHPESWFAQHYPEVAPFIDPDGDELLDYASEVDKTAGYNTDDPLVCLLEVWYRRYDAKEKRYSIHMAKVAGGCLLEDSRTGFGMPDGKGYPKGIYEHGMYPFTVFRLRKRKGTCYGTGMCHEFADTQRMINRYIRYIDENIRASARFKIVLSEQAGVNEADVLDWNKEVIKVRNGVVREGMDWFQAKPLNTLVPTMMGVLQDTMKQDSGQNQWSRGETAGGVTAASAINMLQSAGGKISRLHIQDFVNQFKATCERIISMVGEFFEDGRIFSIYGEQGLSDSRQRKLDTEAYKKPGVTIRVMPQRSSPDQVEAFNQKVMRVIELYANTPNPLPPIVGVKMLQMTGKEQIIPLLEENDAQQQLMAQMQQQLEAAMQQLEAVAGENEQLKQGVMELQQQNEQQKQLMAAVGRQIGGQQPAIQGA